MIFNKKQRKKRRIAGIRSKIKGTSKLPRLSIFRSLTGISVQVVDDEKGVTLAAFGSREIKGGKNNLETAGRVGSEIAKKSLAKKIKEVVFDRHGYKYHGKVKALAEGARKAGLKF